MKPSTLARAVSASVLGTLVCIGSPQGAPRVCDDPGSDPDHGAGR